MNTVIKLHLLAFLLLLSPLLHAQSTDSLGLDDQPSLTSYESAYLNEVIANRGSFDFTGKKVAFVTGKASETISSKSEYFKAVKAGFTRSWLNTLTPEEKELSGNYDVFITYGGVKLLTAKRKRQLLKELKKGFY